MPGREREEQLHTGKQHQSTPAAYTSVPQLLPTLPLPLKPSRQTIFQGDRQKQTRMVVGSLD